MVDQYGGWDVNGRIGAIDSTDLFWMYVLAFTIIFCYFVIVMVIYSLNSNDVTKVTLSDFLKQMHAWIHVRVYALNISLVFVFTYINCNNFFGVNVICVLCDFNYANNFLIYIAQFLWWRIRTKIKLNFV